MPAPPAADRRARGLPRVGDRLACGVPGVAGCGGGAPCIVRGGRRERGGSLAWVLLLAPESRLLTPESNQEICGKLRNVLIYRC